MVLSIQMFFILASTVNFIRQNSIFLPTTRINCHFFNEYGSHAGWVPSHDACRLNQRNKAANPTSELRGPILDKDSTTRTWTRPTKSDVDSAARGSRVIISPDHVIWWWCDFGNQCRQKNPGLLVHACACQGSVSECLGQGRSGNFDNRSINAKLRLSQL